MYTAHEKYIAMAVTSHGSPIQAMAAADSEELLRLSQQQLEEPWVC